MIMGPLTKVLLRVGAVQMIYCPLFVNFTLGVSMRHKFLELPNAVSGNLPAHGVRQPLVVQLIGEYFCVLHYTEGLGLWVLSKLMVVRAG